MSADLSPRQLQRVGRDSYYTGVLAHYGEEVLASAGWFDDLADVEVEAPVWLTTPAHKLQEGVVLLATGGFSPVHEGHIAMMERARECLEAAGVAVGGGYLSPSHDVYVDTKHAGSAARPCEERISELEAVLFTHPWLMVDPWEGRYCASSVNFTDVIVHLEKTLSRFERKREVVYVFGSDNAGFVRAFVEQGRAVCVPREGYPVPAWVGEVAPGRVLVADGEPLRGSSSLVRSSGRALEQVLAQRARHAEGREGITYHVRDDLAGSSTLPAERLEAFRNGMLHLLEDSFPDVQLHVHSAAEQQAQLESILLEGKVLNLDPLTQGGDTLEVSRLFALCDGQYSAGALVNRPGSAPLAEQLSRLTGSYTAVDDDIATGRTMREVRSLLAGHQGRAQIVRECSLLQMGAAGEVYDVVDLRDFLVGSRHGGLVVGRQGSRFRAVYALPYVSPVSRARILPERVMAFSLQVWRLNVLAYQGSRVKLGMLEKGSAEYLYAAGYGLEDEVEAVCASHVQLLENPPFALSRE